MFRHAASYLALTVLLGASNFGIATTENHAMAHDERRSSSLAMTPPVIKKKDLDGRLHRRALGGAINSFWTQVGQTIKGIQEEENLGYAVDVSDDGSVLVATAPFFDDGNVNNTGRTQVYRRSYNKKTKRSVWKKMGQAIMGDENSEFGHAVKISSNGKVLAVGSDNTNDDAGHIQVYFWSKQKKWMALGGSINGTFADDELGWSFDLSEDGKTMVAGSSKHNTTGEKMGKTEIFTYRPKQREWVLKGNPIYGIHNNTGYYKARYGWSVAIDAEGDRVLTSGLWDGWGDDGAVKVYGYDALAKDWVQVGSTLFAHGNITDEYYDEFGDSVAMSKDGSTIAVGAGCYYYCEEGHNQYVHVYRWNDELADWDLIGSINSSDDEDIGLDMKVSLSADGERLGLATSSPNKGYGYAKVYQYNGPMDWSAVGQDLVINELNATKNGYNTIVSLSGDGTHLVVGAEAAGEEEGVDYDIGEVKAYELADDETKSPVAGCMNADVKFKWPSGKKTQYRNCKFVGKKKVQRCKNAAVASMCPSHCGKCFESACEDGPLAWKKGKKAKVDCEWVAEKPLSRCSPINASVCRKTCHTQMYDTLCSHVIQYGCYFKCDQLKLEGETQIGQVGNCGFNCTDGIKPDVNGIVHPELFLWPEHYYQNNEDYSYDTGPLNVQGDDKNMFTRCFNACFA